MILKQNFLICGGLDHNQSKVNAVHLYNRVSGAAVVSYQKLAHLYLPFGPFLRWPTE